MHRYSQIPYSILYVSTLAGSHSTPPQGGKEEERITTATQDRQVVVTHFGRTYGFLQARFHHAAAKSSSPNYIKVVASDGLHISGCQ